MEYRQLPDGPHGVRKQAGSGDQLGLNPSLPATCFPTAATIANSWDPALGEEISECLGEEAASQGVGVLLGHGPLVSQLGLHFLTTVAVFLVMNLFTCVWNPVTVVLISNEAVRNTISSVVTTAVTGGVAMVIIFAVDNKIFAPDFRKK